MPDLNDYCFAPTRGKETFYTDGLNDEDLMSLVEQTGIKTVTIDLAFVAPFIYDRWQAQVQLNQGFRFGWSDTSPLRAIAGAVILCYLGEQEWDSRSDAAIAQAEDSAP